MAPAQSDQHPAQRLRQRILALDIGEVRTGIALSDVDRLNATALQVMDTQGLCADNSKLHELIADYEVGSLVIGLPLLADGSEGSQARRTRSLAAKMLQGMDALCHLGEDSCTGCTDERVFPVIFFNEQQSSKQAKDLGHKLGLSERDMRGKVDSFAAAVFLQRYLDTIDA